MPLIGLVFSVRAVNYGSSFFPIDLWPVRHKSMEENEADNIIWLLPVSGTGNKCRTRDLTVI